MINPSPEFWGVLVLCPLVINLIARARLNGSFVDACGMSMFVAVLWLMTHLMDQTYPFPHNKALHPMFDLAGGMTAMGLWISKPKTWKLVLAYLFAIQCFFDVVFAIAIITTPAHTLQYPYVLALNLLFIGQLIALAWQGGKSVAGDVLDYLLRMPDLVHSPRSPHGRLR